jgi:hypothetical protein
MFGIVYIDAPQIKCTLGGTFDLMAPLNPQISLSHSDGDAYRCPSSLRSELRLIEVLLSISKQCLSPKLKTHALELHARKVKLKEELKVRSEEQKALRGVA